MCDGLVNSDISGRIPKLNKSIFVYKTNLITNYGIHFIACNNWNAVLYKFQT
jgi:hypothetical protein